VIPAWREARNIAYKIRNTTNDEEIDALFKEGMIFAALTIAESLDSVSTSIEDLKKGFISVEVMK
jgi:hypothetical protein